MQMQWRLDVSIPTIKLICRTQNVTKSRTLRSNNVSVIYHWKIYKSIKVVVCVGMIQAETFGQNKYDWLEDS